MAIIVPKIGTPEKNNLNPVTAPSGWVGAPALKATTDIITPVNNPAIAKPNFTIHQYMAPKTPSLLLPDSNSSISQTSAVMDIIKVNKLPIPKEKNGKANKNI